MKKLLFAMALIFVLSFSFASAIFVDMNWEGGSTQSINLNYGETANYEVSAFTTSGPNNGQDHTVTLDMYILDSNGNQLIGPFNQETNLYSIYLSSTLDSTVVNDGDYVLRAVAEDIDDPYPNGQPRIEISELEFSVTGGASNNVAPVMQEVVISPAPTHVTDDLSGTCRATDADGDNLMFEYRWVQNTNLNHAGTTNYFTQNTVVSTSLIASSQTNVNDIWTLECRAFDGVDYSSWMSDSVTILDNGGSNVAPVMNEVIITPGLPHTTDNLLGACRASDSDDDSLVYEFRWYQDGGIISSDTTGPAPQNVLTNVDPISSVLTDVNEVWTLECRAFDGVDYSSWMSDSVTILDNGGSNEEPVNLTLTVPSQVYTYQNIPASCVADDPNNDLLAYTINWFVNGVYTKQDSSGWMFPSTDFNAVLSSAYTSVGDVVTVQCSVSDGEFLVGPVTKSVLVVNNITNNTNPQAIDAAILPSNPTTDNDLNGYCDVFDEDGDSLVVNYVWSQNGIEISSGSVSTGTSYGWQLINKINSSITNVNDGFVFSCQAYDGDLYSNWAYSDVTIIGGGNNSNNAPTNLTLTVPSQVTVDEDILASCVADDLDNDSLSYTITWSIDDVSIYQETSSWMLPSINFNSVLDSSFTSVDDIVIVQCTVTDGQDVVGPVTDSVLVVDNGTGCLDEPVADIQGPNEVIVGNSAVFDGSNSIPSDCSNIELFNWTITCGSNVDSYSSSNPYLSYTFMTVGTCMIELTVTDALGLTDSAIHFVNVADQPCNLKAVVSTPDVVDLNEDFAVNGFNSIGNINSYNWVLYDSNNNVVDTHNYATWYTSLDQEGEYTFELTVSNNVCSSISSGTVLVTDGELGGGDGDLTPINGDNDNLVISSINFFGGDYDTFAPGDTMFIHVTVRNEFDYRVDDVQVAFQLPEFGQIHSSTTSIDPSESQTFIIAWNVPSDFEEGYYYPEIVVTAENGLRRVKARYFEVFNY